MLAGSGPLPARIVTAARAAGHHVLVLAFHGTTDPALVESVEHRWLHVGAVGGAIDALHQAAIQDVVLIGAMQRPALSELGLDRRGMSLLARTGLRRLGDNQLLSAIVAELEAERFRVVGADSLLADVLAREGALSRLEPDADALNDIALGVEVVTHLGDLDIGQAAVVQQGVVLGVEAIEGTDQLVSRCGRLARPGRGAVLVKLKKPGQERRADLPTIGAETIRVAAAAGLAGIAVQAGHCLVIDRDDLRAAADRAGMFVIGISSP